MARTQESYTIVRYWKTSDAHGMDILGNSKTYGDAAKLVEDLAANHPWCDWEFEDMDIPDRFDIEEVDWYDADGSEPIVRDLFGGESCEESRRYKGCDSYDWTYAYFYIVASERI